MQVILIFISCSVCSSSNLRKMQTFVRKMGRKMIEVRPSGLVYIALIGLCVVQSVKGFATPSSDFLLGIDGSSIATGHGHVCVLEQKAGEGVGGRAQCWGNEHKEGATEAPKDMNFVQIVAGDDFTCGMTLEQTVFCWGGVSGYIPGLYEQITGSSYGRNGCGVLTDGHINCWGSERVSDLAPRTSELRFVQVSCSKNHCCALDSNAYPHCWSEAPAEMREVSPPTITYFQYVAAVNGPGVDMAVLQNMPNKGTKTAQASEEEEDFESDGAAKSGLSGEAAADESVSKIQFRQISVGEGTSCGITLLGAHLQCWGGREKNPVRSTGPYRQVSVGRRGICAITASPAEGANASANNEGPLRSREGDKLHCWGMAESLVFYSDQPSAAPDQWDQITVGSTMVCGVTMDSELRCWGNSLPHEFKDHPAKYIVA